MKLIDIDVFRAENKFAEKCADCKRDSKWECDRQMYSARDICGWLDDAEIVDAEPVRHGHWTTARTWQHDGEWYCSVCDYEPKVFDNSPYCPMCGAKMKYARSVADVESGQWISIKDKLPEKSGRYIVYGCSKEMKKAIPECVPIWICDYSVKRGEWYMLEYNKSYDFITHWMPLPEPPKEDNDGENTEH